jgi:hypothetical protein
MAFHDSPIGLATRIISSGFDTRELRDIHTRNDGCALQSFKAFASAVWFVLVYGVRQSPDPMWARFLLIRR